MWEKLLCSFCVVMFTFAVDGYFIEAEKCDGIYRTGETVRFKITNPEGEKLLYTVNFGEGESQPVELAGDLIECELDRPGFILVKLFRPGEKKPSEFVFAGAAVDPEKIVSGTPMPEDFDCFWDRLVTDQRQKKLEVLSMEQIESPDPEVMVFTVRVRRGDLESTGFLAMPGDASPEKRYPALLFFGGASWVNANLRLAIVRAKLGLIAYQPDFHAFEALPTLPPKVRVERREKVKDYQYSNVTDKNLYPMKDIFLRALLAVDFIASRPESNHRKLIAMGGSLGGAQAIAASALAPDLVTFCIATVPAMSDHFGAKEKHLPGWPNLLAVKPEAAAIAPYFDTVNLLKRVKAPVVFSAGFVDVTVPPSSVYAAYNSFAGEKKMVAVKFAGHGANIRDPRGSNAISGGGRDLLDYLRKK